MRPCNQCRKPVENDVHLCESCQQYNEENDIEPKPLISTSPLDPTNLKPVPLDASINTMAFGFAVSMLVFATLIGLVAGGGWGALAGAVFAVLATILFTSAFR